MVMADCVSVCVSGCFRLGLRAVIRYDGKTEQRISMNEQPICTRPIIAMPGHEPSLLPAGKNWRNLAWNDEFDFTVDYVRVFDAV